MGDALRYPLPDDRPAVPSDERRSLGVAAPPSAPPASRSAARSGARSGAHRAARPGSFTHHKYNYVAFHFGRPPAHPHTTSHSTRARAALPTRPCPTGRRPIGGPCISSAFLPPVATMSKQSKTSSTPPGSKEMKFKSTNTASSATCATCARRPPSLRPRPPSRPPSRRSRPPRFVRALPHHTSSAAPLTRTRPRTPLGRGRRRRDRVRAPQQQ